MTLFYLPDLGEGLVEAEIHHWHVKVGDEVKIDQPLVSVETAKALVEIPSPQAGRIEKLFGNEGDMIKTAAPLIAFADEAEDKSKKTSIVGNLEENDTLINESHVIIGRPAKEKSSSVKAMPAVRELAKKMQVDLNQITATGAHGEVSAEDVKKFAELQHPHFSEQVELLQGVRRFMAKAMTQAALTVVPVTLFEDADITHFPTDADITVRVIQAIVNGAKAVPALNVWYDEKNQERYLPQEVHLGLAIDSEEGLFVPVLKNAEKKSAKELRSEIDDFKQAIRTRTVQQTDLQGMTISLSNFGTIAGRYATPILLPPTVAILGCGKIRDTVLARQGKIEIGRIVPLSLTFDHRVVTGGEASRFLATVIVNLEERKQG